jgi:hypothetical protein
MSALALLLAVLTSGPAAAWNCDVHVGVSLGMDLSKAGLPKSDARRPSELCPKRDKDRNVDMQGYKAKEDRAVADAKDCTKEKLREDLVLGSHDPDFGRDMDPKASEIEKAARALKHNGSPRKNAGEAFNGAVKAAEAGRACGLSKPEFAQGAYTGLGNAFHYYGDLAAFDKDFDGKRKERLREVSDRLIESWLGFEPAGPGMKDALFRRIGPRDRARLLDEARAAASSMGMKELLADGLNRHKEDSKFVAEALSESRTEGVTDVVYRAFARMTAAQERMLELLEE